MATGRRLHHAGTGPVNPAEVIESTDHTVGLPQGTARRLTVDHAFYAAIQYDFYIPTLIWTHPAVRAFFGRIDSVDASATLFPGATGIWRGQPEGTTIYRKILRGDQVLPELTRRTFQHEIGRLMSDLSLSQEHLQQAVMFTETVIHVSMSNNLRRS